jgi:hypothetical protein
MTPQPPVPVALRPPTDAALPGTGPEEGTWLVWAIILLPTAALLIGLSVRRVGRDELVLVVRRGRVVRSRGAGLAWRVPGAEHFVVVPTARQVVPLVGRGVTRDDVDVLVLAGLVLAVHRVPAGTAYDDPAVAAARVAEAVLAEAVRGFSAESLVGALGDLEACLPDAITRRLPDGSVADRLVVTEIEAQLTPRLARVLNRADPSGPP